MAVIAAILVISVPIYLNYSVKSTTASTEKLILNSNDLSGWTQTDHTDTPKEDLLISGVEEWSYVTFHNASADNGTDLAINVISFQSNDAAQNYYNGVSSGSPYSLARNADKAVNSSFREFMPDPSNQNISLPFLVNNYDLILNNVVVRIGFQSILPTTDFPANYTSPEWMNNIVGQQMDKINQNMGHLF